jgi:hypothetical protein
VHRTKNRLIAIPAEVQRRLGLERRPNNDILLVSIRKSGSGRWNHHYVKLTHDAEFGIPADVAAIGAGDPVEVKVHEIYSGTPKCAGGASLLLALASSRRPGWRASGSLDVDERLASEARG